MKSSHNRMNETERSHTKQNRSEGERQANTGCSHSYVGYKEIK